MGSSSLVRHFLLLNSTQLMDAHKRRKRGDQVGREKETRKKEGVVRLVCQPLVSRQSPPHSLRFQREGDRSTSRYARVPPNKHGALKEK